MDERTFNEFVEFVRPKPGAVTGMTHTPYSGITGGIVTFLLPGLIRESERHRAAWDGLNYTVQTELRNHRPLPDALAEWVADVLAGRRPQPKRKGRPPENRARDELIIFMVRLLWSLRAVHRAAARDRHAVCRLGRILR